LHSPARHWWRIARSRANRSLDDSIRGERWDIVLERGGTGAWAIKEVKRAWSCRRGAGQQRFATSKCQ
jgi:hypothetical protein